MRTAICPGSFDPVTKGHLDIIQRASKLFDKVIVLVATNSAKVSCFTTEERMDMLRKVTKDIPNVEVDAFCGLLASYAEIKNACAIVKGLRAVSDFEYEFQMALANKKLYYGAETVFVPTRMENMYLSSSIVKQVAGYGGDISAFVPEEIHDEIKARLSPKK